MPRPQFEELGRGSIHAYLLKTSLHQRQAYPQSVVLGGTVSQVSGAKPAQAEVQALVKELLSLLELQ
jgi:hypothetical protein